MSQHTITIYSTPTCTYCNLAKDFFKKEGFEYKEFNVAEDADARNDMIEKSGQMGVPVIMIDDTMIVGFNEDKIKTLLS